MRFDWSEYLNLAQELAAISGDSDNNEAKLRSVVSRAYYAVFCLARNYLRDVEQDSRLSRKNSDINEHQYVAEEFIFHKSKAKKIIKIGENLSRLRLFRNKADYEDRVFTLSSDVKIALKIAQNIMASLSELNRVHWNCLWGGRVYEIVAFYRKFLVNPPLQIRLVTSNPINVSATANRSTLPKL